jgi:hypothetical protein
VSVYDGRHYLSILVLSSPRGAGLFAYNPYRSLYLTVRRMGYNAMRTGGPVGVGVEGADIALDEVVGRALPLRAVRPDHLPEPAQRPYAAFNALTLSVRRRSVHIICP